jgi:Berberine and berberine like
VIDAYWTNDFEKAAAEAWLLDFEQLRGAFFDTGIYQNYPRRSYANFRESYWGFAFGQLLRVKQKYDPNNVFHYQQSISPYPETSAPSA